MPSCEENHRYGLEAGQLWKLEHGYVFIVELGKRAIRYQLLREATAKSAVSHMIPVESLLAFLRHAEATLVSLDLAAAADRVLWPVHRTATRKEPFLRLSPLPNA